MNQSSVSAHEPIPFAINAALIEGAARDLEDFSEDYSMTLGHWPSWIYPQLPDGLALCVGCWRPITARQLGVERCLVATPRLERERLAEYLK